MGNNRIADRNEILELLTRLMRDSEDEKTQMRAAEQLAKFAELGEKDCGGRNVQVIDDIV